MGKEPDQKDINKLKAKLNEFVDKDRKDRELEEKNAATKQAEYEKAKKRRQDWYEGYRIKSQESANIIWYWYKEFVDSSSFQEIIESLKKTKAESLWLSETIECTVPNSCFPDRDWLEKQVLTINISDRKLFVHNIVKYGKSYEIKGVSDLLEHVEPPILIEIAQRITKSTIWDGMKVY